MSKIEIICSTCKSTDVIRDASAAWEVETQDWVLSAVFDQGYCIDCDDEARLEERKIFLD